MPKGVGYGKAPKRRDENKSKNSQKSIVAAAKAATDKPGTFTKS